MTEDAVEVYAGDDRRDGPDTAAVGPPLVLVHREVGILPVVARRHPEDSGRGAHPDR